MSLWIKICANTSLEDARLAVEAGADAVGFVFAPSPRRVTEPAVAEIVPYLPKKVEKIGVFVDAPLYEVEATIRACGLTGVQLHSDVGTEMPAELRKTFGRGLRILRVLHFSADAERDASAIAADGNIDAILVDSRTAHAVGGTGLTFDWTEAAKTLFGEAKTLKHLVAAGGLKPENVAEAIRRLRPWGVDVVSGVEAAPGRKNPTRVRDFIANARAASGRSSTLS